MILVEDGITYQAFEKEICNALSINTDESEAKIRFDTNLETCRGMMVTNDQELMTCMYLLKNDDNFRKSSFIVEVITPPPPPPQLHANSL